MPSLSTALDHPRGPYRQEDFFLLLLSVIFLCLGMYSGLGLTYDSHWYRQGAEFLYENPWYDLLKHRTFRAKPPLYPVFLYLIHQQAILLCLSHIFFWLLTGILSFRLFNYYLPTFRACFTAKLLFLWATPLYLVHMFWWTEPLFLLGGSIYYSLHKAYFHRPGGLVLAGITLTGLAMIFTRHIGIVFCGISGLYLLWWGHTQSAKPSWGLWLNACLGPVLFAAWHYAVIQKIQGYEIVNYTSDLNLFYNLKVMGLGFGQWILPLPWADNPRLSIPLLLFILAFLAHESYIHHRDKRWLLALLSLSSLAYIGLMLLKGDLLPDDIERYLSLIYVPVLLLIVYRLVQYKHSWLSDILLALWMLYPALRTLKNLYFWSGIGF